MTRDEVLALPVTVDVLTAGKAFGFSRNTTYELIKSGSSPFRYTRTARASAGC